MRKMKDSGVEWIDTIPENWKVVPMKALFSFGKGLPITKDNLTDAGIPVISYGQIHARWNSGVTTHKDLFRFVDAFYLETNAQSLVKKGDFIMADTSEDREGCGNCAYIDTDDVIFAGYHTIILHSLSQSENKYLAYLFLTDSWRSQIRKVVSGVKLFSVSRRILGSCSVIVPDNASEIVKFLDKQCAGVNALISNVQAQIEKLKAYKQSLITEVVTKGLDPNVPMKDSGVEWIGEIPKCWNMVRGKALFEECDARSDDGSEELLTVSQYTGVTPRSQKSVNMFESTTLEGYKICEVGDIAANTMWLWAGAIGVSEYRGVISPSYNVYRQKEIKYISSYLDCLLRIPLLVQEYASRSTGIRASRLRLYPKDFMDIMFPVPPIEEQKTIMDILGKKIDMVNQMISIKQSKIEKLELYKRSLIYEYVTGKKEVS